MNLSPAYIQQCEVWRQKGKLEGKLEGALEGQSLMVASLLEGQFGTLDEELSSLIPQIVQLSTSEHTQLLLNLANLSREELIARLLESSN